MGPVRALYWALLLGALVTGALGFSLEHERAALTASTFGYLALAALTGLGAYAGMFYAFSQAHLSVAVPIVSSWAVVAAVFAVVALGQDVAPAHLIGGLVVLAGVLFITTQPTPVRASASSLGNDEPGAAPREPRNTHERPLHQARAGRDERAPRDARDDNARGNSRHRTAVGPAKVLLASLGAAVGFGIMIPTVGQVAPLLGEVTAVAVVYVLFLVVGLPLARLSGLSLAPPPTGTWRLVLVTAFAEAAGFVTVALAPSYAPVAVVAPCASLAAAFTVVYARYFLGEKQSPRVTFGAALTCVGVVVLALA